MAAAAYKHLVGEMELPDLLTQADLLRETMGTHGWKLVLASIDAHKTRMLQRLLHEGTKPDDIPYLRGLINGLESMREAADTILAFAVEREAEAKQRREAQESYA